jgi:hypothetical protein
MAKAWARDSGRRFRVKTGGSLIGNDHAKDGSLAEGVSPVEIQCDVKLIIISVVLKTSYRYNVPTRYMYHPTAHHKVLSVMCIRGSSLVALVTGLSDLPWSLQTT